MAAGLADILVDTLVGAVRDPAAVRTNSLDRHAMAHDASHYLLVPDAVVTARSTGDVSALLRACHDAGIALTFRSGGTSLSGQSVSDSVLVDTRRHFRDIEILDDGARVRVQPGVTVRHLNARLAPYGRKFGPDPASEIACTVGGVVANNSSGMACGVVDNTYQTLESATLVLPSGTVLDSGAPDADEHLRAREPDLHAGLISLRDRVRGNAASVGLIERQFSMKNTMGYGLNAFLDYDRPADILTHLVVGSEGTLAFVAEAVFRTVPVRPHAATGLLVFESLFAATDALPALVATGAATIELLDAASIRVAREDPRAPDSLRAVEVVDHAALLVEYQADDPTELAEVQRAGAAIVDGLPLVTPAAFTRDPAVRAQLWHVRKGLYAAVAGARPSGTTALLEDVVVPVDALARTCTALRELFDRHGYADSAVIFGHAKDGNIHFMLTDRFEGPEAVGRYTAFTDAMVDLVLAAGGSLKAEHGTGRVMAPYVRRQYGDELYDVMRGLKTLVDSRGVLNPGVILDDDPEAHIRHVKNPIPVEEEVDRCVECGFCEPVCPSRDLTLTPRQRIVLRRAEQQARRDGDTALADELASQYDYPGLQTCAVDGMCQTACPVDINTGDLVKRLRVDTHGRLTNRGWAAAAKHWSTTTRAASAGLSVAAASPDALASGASTLARTLGGAENVPQWSPDLPAGGRRRSRRSGAASPPDSAPVAVYLPSCVNAMFGPAETSNGERGTGVQSALERLCRAAGVVLVVPADVDALCCGTPWTSKGLTAGARVMRDRTATALATAAATPAGHDLPVITDASSCTEGLRTLPGLPDGTRIVDAVEFVAETLLPRIPPVPDDAKVPSVVVHDTCASTRGGFTAALQTVAAAVAHDVRRPVSWGCCAFAGDRGMLHPELTASATRVQAAEIAALDGAAHVSCNRTCEIGMTRATGKEYRHVIEVLADLVDAQRTA